MARSPRVRIVLKGTTSPRSSCKYSVVLLFSEGRFSGRHDPGALAPLKLLPKAELLAVNVYVTGFSGGAGLVVTDNSELAVLPTIVKLTLGVFGKLRSCALKSKPCI